MAKNYPSLTRSAVAAISAGPCTALLKSREFRRAAPNFWRETDSIYQSISFQASQWGTHGSGKFTVNLGVTSPTLYKGFTGRELPKNPASLLWPVNRRIGSLMDNRCDIWWSVEKDTDIAKLGREVAESLESHALPFLDSIRAPQQLYTAVLTEGSVTGLSDAQLLLVRATLAAQIGDKDSARSFLDEALRTYQGKPFESTVRQIEEALRSQL
jgi:hypothetical protein